MSRANPAIERACKFLEQIIDESKTKSDFLPSLQQLAELAHVSRTSMWKAVALFKKQGQVQTTERGRIFLAGNGDAHPITSSANSGSKTWERKRAILEQDIISGRYRPGAVLPSGGILQKNYGVSFASLKKILSAMVQDGVLRPYKKSYIVPDVDKQKFGARVIWVSGIGNLTGSGIYEQNSRNFLDAIERECAQINVSLEMVTIDYVAGDITAQMARIPTHNEPVAGYVLNLWWIEYRQPEKINAIISHIAHTGIQLAILDQVGQFELAPEFISLPNIRVFRCAARIAGQAMARLYLSKGHTCVAYLSQSHEYLWSRQRLLGMAEQYEKAGLRSHVHPYVHECIGGYFEQVVTACGFTRDIFKQVFHGHAAEKQFLQALDSEDPVQEQKLFSIVGQQTITGIRKSLALLPEMLKTEITPDVFGRIREALISNAVEKINNADMETVCKAAARDASVSGWIVGTDGLAIAALRFLSAQKIRIPLDLSVSGFDNSADSLNHGLTTFDFNLSHLSRTILGFLLARKKQKEPQPPAALEIPGLIIIRESVGKPGKNRSRYQETVK